MTQLLRIGNAQGFWGDQPDAPAKMLSQQPDLDYLTLDYLAELSMSILAIQRQKDPTAGYAKDFVQVVKSLVPFWRLNSHCRVVTNAGGLNPLGCAQACREALAKAGHPLKIGVVTGDDVLALMDPSLTTANAYLVESRSNGFAFPTWLTSASLSLKCPQMDPLSSQSLPKRAAKCLCKP